MKTIVKTKKYQKMIEKYCIIKKLSIFAPSKDNKWKE